MFYNITITQPTTRNVNITADDLESAIDKAREMFGDGFSCVVEGDIKEVGDEG